MNDDPLTLGGIGLEPVHGAATLVNLAETLQQLVLPQLQGHPQKAAAACVEVLSHLAAAVQAPAASRAALEALVPGDGADAALAEGQVFEASFQRAEALIRAIGAVTAAPAVRRVDPARVQRYLQEQPEGGPKLCVLRAEPLPGGRSKQTILVSVDGAKDLPAELVIRQDWAAAVTGTGVAMEFEILRRVHAAGIRVPRPLLLEAGAEALGAPFIVVTRLPGQAQGNLYDPPPDAGPVRDLAVQIGKTHALAVGSFEGLPGVVERSFTVTQLKADLAKFRTVIEQLGRPLPRLVVFALDWLDSTVGEIRGPRTLVHGDVGFHNNLCDGPRLSAVLDWEMAHLGNPALDVGYLKTAVEKAVPWAEFLRLYREAGGADVEPFAVDWFSVYTKVWLLHLLLQARAAVAGGVLKDIDYTQVCAHYPAATLAHLSRALRAVVAPQRFPPPFNSIPNAVTT